VTTRPPRVLVVDDSVVVRHVLTFTVRQLPGFAHAVIDETSDGVAAFAKVQGEKYRFILADVRMPRMDGIELVSRIRGELGDKETPVVLITTLGTQADRERGMAAGATAYVIKPLSPHHIRTALLEILDPADETSDATRP
jgi:two-component system, chemotaxis family, chemotaxis protein CheY